MSDLDDPVPTLASPLPRELPIGQLPLAAGLDPAELAILRRLLRRRELNATDVLFAKATRATASTPSRPGQSRSRFAASTASAA